MKTSHVLRNYLYSDSFQARHRAPGGLSCPLCLSQSNLSSAWVNIKCLSQYPNAEVLDTVLHISWSLSRNSPSYEEKRTDNTPDGGWAEQWNYWITSTVPQLSLISWPEVWHVSRPAPPQSWYPVMLSSQPEIQFLSGHVRVGSEGWPPIWEVGFQWLSGGWRPSGKTGDQTRGRWGWKVSRRRERYWFLLRQEHLLCCRLDLSAFSLQYPSWHLNSTLRLSNNLQLLSSERY